ncbi:Oidioi.mRNA.OKI2018_I69.chr1.g477.t1.cds [Oikopleura dioica]|uniref:Oidioi.mRNA.OKI2018_I69.chr1.g477.t1.cds n=1 Tax=Oikopleura dioica TaxID=34765 RepID=A0ABN7SQ05_OIKDI|nr:Oidioi.mRNA.OKI2018_I69.chr1.g477.t1.cds [Oikopleura dioica]
MKLLNILLVGDAFARKTHHFIAEIQGLVPKFESYTGENEKIKDDIFKYKQEAGKAILHGELMTDGQLRAILSEGSTINQKILRELIEFRMEKKKGVDFRKPRQSASDGEDMLLNYGCFCLPSQMHSPDGNWLGKGSPVDEVDSLCHDIFRSYNCLKKDFPESKCDSTIPYNYKLDKRGVPFCTDPEDTCEGTVCRLEIEFMTQFVKVADKWSQANHISGGFDRQSQCLGNMSERQIEEAKSEGQSGRREKSKVFSETQCCGNGIKRHPYQIHKFECCPNGQTKLPGTCLPDKF